MKLLKRIMTVCRKQAEAVTILVLDLKSHELKQYSS